ncbi:hypothetical protein QBC34DRAFT_306915 [Podospora aff. communis PSN243]|uniref:Uncharacterized protein n=1 Tax=Podospora aff. communis PSN243 TaxID=3040156 RepID=A0AAV9GCB0_9PEZI|nr:hypothetical protein QBC34DRAFT_306915 [Podospora aff. communis PSN243]
MASQIPVSINFLKRLELYKTEKPFRIHVGQPAGLPEMRTTNIETEPKIVMLTDVRGKEGDYNLDTHGFQFVTHHQEFSSFTEAQAVEKEYLPEVETVILDNVPGADRAVVFDWRIRKQLQQSYQDRNVLVSPLELQDPTLALAPSQTVHTGIKMPLNTYTLRKRVKMHLGEEAKELLEGRVQMIKQLRRPIKHTAYNWPLVLCDSQTSPLEQLVSVDQVGWRFVGDIYYAPYDPLFRWYFQSAMTTKEGVIIKSWDTDLSARSRFCLHSSCSLPDGLVPNGSRPRASIEVRALVFLLDILASTVLKRLVIDVRSLLLQPQNLEVNQT